MRRLSLIICLLSLAACTPQARTTPTPSTGIAAVVAASEMVVGQNRFPIGLVRSGTPLNEPQAEVSMRFFALSTPEPDLLRDTETARYFGQGLPAGLYVAYPTFDHVGQWRVEIDVRLPGMDAPQTSNRLFEVVEQANAVPVGQPAVSITTPTAADGRPLAEITSALSPDPALYQISLDQALASGQPTVVLFATPGYCRTAVCAPNVMVLSQLQQAYGDRANIIHVEVYEYPFNESFQRGRTVPAMQAWNLRTEPWLYLIDAEGIVQARYEGGITREELEPAIQRLLAGQPILP